MSALALGPGSGVFRCGAFMAPISLAQPTSPPPRRDRLLALPAGALRSVLQQDAAAGQFVPDAVALGEIAAPAGRLAGLDEGQDFMLWHWRRRFFGAAQR